MMIASKKYLYQFGHAIWWYVAPTIINTFLEKGHFEEKRHQIKAKSEGSATGPQDLDKMKLSIKTKENNMNYKYLKSGVTLNRFAPPYSNLISKNLDWR